MNSPDKREVHVASDEPNVEMRRTASPFCPVEPEKSLMRELYDYVEEKRLDARLEGPNDTTDFSAEYQREAVEARNRAWLMLGGGRTYE